MRKLGFLLPLAFCFHFSTAQTYTSSLVAGVPPIREEVNPLKFKGMTGIVENKSGELLACDNGNNLIRKIQWDGKIVVVAGDGSPGHIDGVGSSAKFQGLKGMVIDSKENLYVIESNSPRIRKITPEGTVSTFAGSSIFGDNPGKGEEARLGELGGIAIDDKDNIYVTDNYSATNTGSIKKIDTAALVTTLWTDQIGLTAIGVLFNTSPVAICYSQGPKLKSIVDNGNQRYMLGASSDLSLKGIGGIQFINSKGSLLGTTNGSLYTMMFSPHDFSGMNSFTFIPSSTFFYSSSSGPKKGAVLGSYQDLYNASFQSSPVFNNIYPVNTTINRDLFSNIQGMIADSVGNLYITDRTRILKMDKQGIITTFVGSEQQGGLVDGNGTDARLSDANRLAWDRQGNLLVTSNKTLRKISPNGDITTFRDGKGTPLDLLNGQGIALDSKGNIFIASYTVPNAVYKIGPNNVMSTYVDDAFIKSKGYSGMGMPLALQVDKQDNLIMGMQMDGVFFVVSADKSTVKMIGKYGGGSLDGPLDAANFVAVEDFVLDNEGNIFVMDANIVRKISASGSVSTIAGDITTNSGNSGGYQEGTGVQIKVNFPWSLTISKEGDIYIGDSGNNLIRVLKKDVTTGIYGISEPVPISDGFVLFPNPAKSHLTLRTLEQGELFIHDGNGQLVAKRDLQVGQTEMELGHLGKGFYHLLLQTATQRHTKKLVLD